MLTIRQWAENFGNYNLQWISGNNGNNWLGYEQHIGINNIFRRKKIYQDKYGMDAWIQEKCGGKILFYYIRQYNFEGNKVYDFFENK